MQAKNRKIYIKNYGKMDVPDGMCLYTFRKVCLKYFKIIYDLIWERIMYGDKK